MASSLFTELSASEATSLVGGQRFASAFGSFSASATSTEGRAVTDGNVTTSASLDGDDASASSSGFSSSFAGEPEE